MQCPSCNHLNAAMSVRCEGCGTVLIHEAVGHSKAWHDGARLIDRRMAAGLGGLTGFFVPAVLLTQIFTTHPLDDREVYGVCAVSGAIGAVAGLWIAMVRETR